MSSARLSSELHSDNLTEQQRQNRAWTIYLSDQLGDCYMIASQLDCQMGQSVAYNWIVEYLINIDSYNNAELANLIEDFKQQFNVELVD